MKRAKVTTKALAKAIEEHLDAVAALTKETWKISVYPSTINRAERSKKKLERLISEINMEAKDEVSRRSSKK